MGIYSFANLIYIYVDPHIYMKMTPVPNRSVCAVADLGTCSVFLQRSICNCTVYFFANTLTEALLVDIYPVP